MVERPLSSVSTLYVPYYGIRHCLCFTLSIRRGHVGGSESQLQYSIKRKRNHPITCRYYFTSPLCKLLPVPPMRAFFLCYCNARNDFYFHPNGRHSKEPFTLYSAAAKAQFFIVPIFSLTAPVHSYSQTNSPSADCDTGSTA